MGVKVTTKYIITTANDGEADLEAFIERSAALKPESVILDIDYNFPDADSRTVQAITRLKHLGKTAGLRMIYGHTGDRFAPEYRIGERMERMEADLSGAGLLAISGSNGVSSEVSCVIPGTASIGEIEENTRAGRRAIPSGTIPNVVLDALISELNRTVCSRCGEYDSTCSRGLKISSMFRSALVNL